MDPLATIIIAFYNDVQLLKLVLVSLKNQYKGQFEVIIADDGSKKEAVDQVIEILNDCPFPSKHLWHHDDGFRKAIILNRAVISAKGEILIFIDADCIPQTHFVDDHIFASKEGFCAAGRRIDCFREAINQIDLRSPERIVLRNSICLFYWSIKRKARNIEKGLRLPRSIAKKIKFNTWSLVGCNFSVRKEDLLSVNGFDERHKIPWGAEDSDIQRRLLIKGLKIKSLRYQAIMIHLDSTFLKRKRGKFSGQDQGSLFYTDAAEDDLSWTRFGISKKNLDKN